MQRQRSLTAIVLYGNGRHKYAQILYCTRTYVDRPVAFDNASNSHISPEIVLMYSMDKIVRFSILLLTLVSQKDSREALNFIWFR